MGSTVFNNMLHYRFKNSFLLNEIRVKYYSIWRKFSWEELDFGYAI